MIERTRSLQINSPSCQKTQGNKEDIVGTKNTQKKKE